MHKIFFGVVIVQLPAYLNEKEVHFHNPHNSLMATHTLVLFVHPSGNHPAFDPIPNNDYNCAFFYPLHTRWPIRGHS